MEDPAKTTEAAARSKRVAAATAEYPWPRLGNMLLGMWLQVSAFAWPHSDGSRISSWVMGLLIAVVSVLSLGSPPMRWLNAILAVWLMVWTTATALGDRMSFLNGMISGALVLLLSFLGSRSLASDFKE